MQEFVIQGGRPLHGDIRVGGAKNSILPIMAATVLSKEPVLLRDCPDLDDAANMIYILKSTGCKVKREGDTLWIDPRGVHNFCVPDDYVVRIRSSVVIMGALISRLGRVVITYPGGCDIGRRPIDIHLEGLKALGVRIKDLRGSLSLHAEKLIGNTIKLSYPSVGATENIMLAAAMADGTTIIKNAAREPEIVDLQNMMNDMGGSVSGAGGNEIHIDGKQQYHGADHKVIPDRITAATYALAAAITGGDVYIRNVMAEHMMPLINKLKQSGCIIDIDENSMRIRRTKRHKAVDETITSPYPGFPTDMQSMFMAYLSTASGVSRISEMIFENRFKHVQALSNMGADILLSDRLALITGVEKLHGCEVTAGDLRGGAALVLAGLAAKGETIVKNISHIDRGYQCFEDRLTSIGADIIRVGK